MSLTRLHDTVRMPPPLLGPESNTHSPPNTIYGVMTDEQYKKYMKDIKEQRSRTRPVFINNLDVVVKVYWFRDSQPDKIYKCCEVLPKDKGGCEGISHATQYIYGTRLKLVWKNTHGHRQHSFAKIVTENQVIRIGEDPIQQWKTPAIKMNYILQQMIRLGGTNETVYPNLAPLLDIVQDIDIPDITENDKQIAGIPSGLTNVI